MSTPLMELELQLSIDENDEEDIKRLAKAGCNLDFQTPDGTMLMRAGHKSFWNIVELLIELGANVYAGHGMFEWKLLHHATRLSWMPVLQFYVAKNFDPDVTTSRGETSLMIAAQMNNKPIVEMLVNAGADINRPDGRRWTAFHYASYKGQIDIVQFLVDNKADVNVQEYRGYTALHLVLRKKCDVEMVGFLISVGVDCNIEDNDGITGFNLLIEKGFLGAIRLGIEKGAYVRPLDYCTLSEQTLLKNNVLKRVNYCSQAIINKYHHKDLPDLYKMLGASNVLPPIERLKFQNNSGPTIEIARSVNQDIQKRGYCDVMNVRPLVLSKMCVESFIDYVRAVQESIAEQALPAPEQTLPAPEQTLPAPEQTLPVPEQTDPPALKTPLRRLTSRAKSAKRIRLEKK